MCILRARSFKGAPFHEVIEKQDKHDLFIINKQVALRYNRVR